MKLPLCPSALIAPNCPLAPALDIVACGIRFGEPNFVVVDNDFIGAHIPQLIYAVTVTIGTDHF